MNGGGRRSDRKAWLGKGHRIDAVREQREILIGDALRAVGDEFFFELRVGEGAFGEKHDMFTVPNHAKAVDIAARIKAGTGGKVVELRQIKQLSMTPVEFAGFDLVEFDGNESLRVGRNSLAESAIKGGAGVRGAGAAERKNEHCGKREERRTIFH